jgi:hypothetical protein
MVQDIIVEILCEYLAILCQYLAEIGFVLICALIIESTIVHDLISKFRAYIKMYFVTIYLEKLRLMNPTRKEIFSLFFIDEIVFIVEMLEDLDYHGQLFIIKAINDYKAERAIVNIFRLFSFKNRVLDAISKYFTLNRQKDQFALIILFFDFVKPFYWIICPLLNALEYVIEKVTFNILTFCKTLLIFFRSL